MSFKIYLFNVIDNKYSFIVHLDYYSRYSHKTRQHLDHHDNRNDLELDKINTETILEVLDYTKLFKILI